MNDIDGTATNDSAAVDSAGSDAAANRREAMLRIAKGATYAAPATLALIAMSKTAMAAS